MPELCSDQEEADTRMLLHSAYAALKESPLVESTIIIRSPDSDVFTICVSHASKVNGKLLFFTGKGDLQRTIDITNIAEHLGSEVSEALIGLHVFTGCDCLLWQRQTESIQIDDQK